MIRSIQAARGVAALLVLLFHASQSIFALPKYFGGMPFGDAFGFGHAGVDFFFVLSGFIIAHAHRDDVGHPERWRKYAWKRIRRIYPPYWVIPLLILPVFFAVPSWGDGHERQPWVIASSLLLLPRAKPPVLGVAWFLCYEVLFYALFLSFLVGRRTGLAVFTIWGALTIALHARFAFPGAFLLNLHNLQFAMGMIVAAVHSRARVPYARAIAVAGAAAFFGAGAVEVCTRWLGESSLQMAYGASSAVLVLGLAEAERAGRLRVPEGMVFLGAASYSIYLAHIPALSLIAKVAVRLGLPNAMPHRAAFVLISVAATAACIGYYLVVERPLLRLPK